MPASPDQIIDALRPVQDPELHRSIVELGMVRHVEIVADGTARSSSPSPCRAAR